METFKNLFEARELKLSKKELTDIATGMVGMYTEMILMSYDPDEDEVYLDRYQDYLDYNDMENSPDSTYNYLVDEVMGVEWYNERGRVADSEFLDSLQYANISNSIKKKFKQAEKEGMSIEEFLSSQTEGEYGFKRWWYDREEYTDSKAMNKNISDIADRLAAYYDEERG